ncbi:uncharacterized protein V6R79_017699 [Siganus canaliculatus]
MKPLLISLLLAAMCLDCRAQRDKVEQPEGDVTATEGHTETLDCHYETTSPTKYLFWYKQEANNSPKYMLLRFNGNDGDTLAEYRERFSSRLNSSTKSVPLEIKNLQLSDSAVYYCALRPTVTGNTKSLYKNLWSKDNTILHNSH